MTFVIGLALGGLIGFVLRYRHGRPLPDHISDRQLRDRLGRSVHYEMPDLPGTGHPRPGRA